MNVLAAIVTHNRRELLSRCLDYFQSQMRQLDAILASTDGTVEMLLRRDIPFVMQESVGSAGGWHRGIQYALEHDFDAAWLIDDDGFADEALVFEDSVAGFRAAVFAGLQFIDVRRDDWCAGFTGRGASDGH